ncbi:tetratricopeptide repeat protein [Burkholderia multivorans]|uniref:tetratricopeptide repeat protein n=1 Tax=Burkholderia multivorans TaxID=87883 RepID=UPI001C22F4B6|nr:tetratricopeptide repeat protein [Burkholderia multivorans]MBU9222616.1 sel1 repeat family protein [Burkholderia multivorans]MBU9415241.1 sel1 repeat family protein [Burkholderia multivorans]MBU9477299.1 sel1 repeat family protein [Burkholderia multivorans]
MQPIRTMRPAESGFAAAARRVLRVKLPPAALLAAAAATVAIAVAAAGWRGTTALTPSAAQLDEWQAMVAQAVEPHALARLRDLARAGSGAAQAALGIALVDAREPGLRDEGRGWLETAAQAQGADNAPAARRAQLALGKALLLGSGDMPKDYARARALLGAAAEHGDAAAAYYLGLIYRSGYGTAADPVQAARWFEIASQAEIPAADFMLANAYRDGSGVPRDEARALALYRRAAEHELPEAVQTLAMAYRNGELGLRPDADAFHAQWIETAHALKHPVVGP